MKTLCTPIGAHYAVTDVLATECGHDAAREARLARDERAQYVRIRNPQRRAQWIAGRIAAKSAVADMMSCAPGTIRIGRHETGAPTVDGMADVVVSISHSGSLAVAVAAPFCIGIDLERNEPRPECFIRAFFCDNERRSLAESTPQRRQREVNRLWTCKEAIAKATGFGASKPFKTIDGSLERVTIEGKPITCRSGFTPSYVVTLAYEILAGETRIDGT